MSFEVKNRKLANGQDIDYSEKKKYPRATPIIFKHVYWNIQQISGEHLQDHWSSCSSWKAFLMSWRALCCSSASHSPTGTKAHFILEVIFHVKTLFFRPTGHILHPGGHFSNHISGSLRALCCSSASHSPPKVTTRDTRLSDWSSSYGLRDRVGAIFHSALGRGE